MLVLRFLLIVGCAMVTCSALGQYPKPSALPPHSWATVGDRVFIHGCKSDGLFNDTELEVAAKFPVMTVEKGQGESQPGWAEDKMAAIAKQYHSKRPDGWTMFYMNANFNWHMYHMSESVEAHPSYWIRNSTGQPCRRHGDPEFPQPADGMLMFNMSNPDMRALFVATAVNATKSAGRFNGIFVDSAAVCDATQLEEAGRKSRCVLAPGAAEQLCHGKEQLLVDLQNAVGSDRLVIAKDNGNYTASRFCNTEFLSDSFCSCYSCNVHAQATADLCNKQIRASIAAGNRGQVVMMHGETNADPSAGSVQEQFLYSLSAYLIATADSGLFGYSTKWYFNGTKWHDEYDKPLGPPEGPAVFADGVWKRSFQHASVTLDVAKHTSDIQWL